MNIKKNIISIMLLCLTVQVHAITSSISHRIMSTSPLLYKMINYAQQQISFEAEPIYMSLYDQHQVAQNIILQGKNTLHFNQQNFGDFNPLWINLGSKNIDADYDSKVTFTPSLTQSGILLHWYENFDHTFLDIKTALVQCKSDIEITEIGGGNGGISNILNAQQAFTQSNWNYGKIGKTHHVVGLDNIEIRFGGVNRSKNKLNDQDIFISGFGIFEIPTGSGTKAEWLFEPQVGTNHWGIGFGFETLFYSHQDLKFMIAANYRYLTPAWETRSFDLINNGEWSRYLGLQTIYGLPTAPTTLPLPGINYFTQQAYIKGRSQLNVYARLEKELRSSKFELSYNLFCLQQESIGTIASMTPGYGIYALTSPSGGGGGVTTASTATIIQSAQTTDPISSPIEISNSDFNKYSAAQGTYATNTLAARFEIVRKNIIYGFGTAIEAGLSNNALSTWSVWAKFEYLFDTTQSAAHENDNYHESIINDTNQTILSVNNLMHDNFIPMPQIIPDNLTEDIQNDFIPYNNQLEFLYDNIPTIDTVNVLEKKEELDTMYPIENKFHDGEIDKNNLILIDDTLEIPEFDQGILTINMGLNLHDDQTESFIPTEENLNNLEQINDQNLSQESSNILEQNDDHQDELTLINLDEFIHPEEKNFDKEFFQTEPDFFIMNDILYDK